MIARLPILILFPHSRCNCRCVMCDIWKTPDSREISPAGLERHVADITSLGVQWVIFSGGEPLMHTDFFALCRLLRPLGIKLTVLSTGLLLGRYAAQLTGHVDEVIVSLDGPPSVHDSIRRVPGAFAALSNGVAAIHRIAPEFPVAARCVVQKQNCESLAATVKTAREIGLRSISFLAADLTSTAFNRPEPWPVSRQEEVGLNTADLAAFEYEIEALTRLHAGDFETGFIVESPEKLRRIAQHFRAQLGQAEPVAPRCNAPWVSAVVESDGTLRPCFFHAAVGNVGQTSLADALNSPQARQFRETLDIATNPICRRCVCSLYLPEDSPLGRVPAR